MFPRTCTHARTHTSWFQTRTSHNTGVSPTQSRPHAIHTQTSAFTGFALCTRAAAKSRSDFLPTPLRFPVTITTARRRSHPTGGGFFTLGGDLHAVVHILRGADFLRRHPVVWQFYVIYCTPDSTPFHAFLRPNQNPDEPSGV